ncbi:putative spermidine/putrescine transport system permease protein [Chelatococcus asaccharovorans]|nr:putative spermidine/putrescine transport system permease protein [Chelatococcus asaccharovorans]CAH1682984.1 putative spermidine/putrescine transport system permease protein [Chelatococcus asaccharovorans]
MLSPSRRDAVSGRVTEAASHTAERVWTIFSGTRFTGYWLVAPAVLFLAIWFLWPVLTMIHLSVSAHSVDGVMIEGFTLDNYIRLFASDLYVRILLRTIRIALLTSVIAALFAYPLAIAIARGGPALARLVTITILAPLLVNVVVRSYGWQTILNKTGALAWVLKLTGITNPPVLLYTEWAVLIACVHVYLPFMVMPLASAIGRIDRAVEEAARVAGAPQLSVMLRVIFPLSLPGLAVGVSLVFSLSAAAYVTPQILGGNFSPLLGTLIEQQILTLNDWPFGAAISTLLIAMVLAANLVFLKVVNRRFARWTGDIR